MKIIYCYNGKYQNNNTVNSNGLGAAAPGTINAFADNSIIVSDDDLTGQANQAMVDVTGRVTASSEGDNVGDTNLSQAQSGSVFQSNGVEDNDVLTGIITDNDGCQDNDFSDITC